MITEILPTIAAEINRHHESAQSLADEAKRIAKEAVIHGAQAGQYIEQVQGITKGQTLAWLRDNVPNLTHERARAYVSLLHTVEGRKVHVLDREQLRFIGFLEQAQRSQAQPTQGKGKADKWVGWVGGIAGHIRGMIQSRPLTDWEREEREAVADQLKPIVELYRALGGRVP